MFLTIYQPLEAERDNAVAGNDDSKQSPDKDKLESSSEQGQNGHQGGADEVISKED